MKFHLFAIALIGSLLVAALANFDSAAQEAIVKAHNDLRSSIAKGTYVAKGTTEPSASNMRKISWDPILASSAQEFAEGCPMDHSKLPGIGENLYWSWNSDYFTDLNPFGVDASKSWEQEFEEFGWTSIVLDQATFDSGIGHATQMAWAKTNLIGCGVKNCGQDSSKEDMYKFVVVCKYKEKGNMDNEKIYEEGETCSACSEGSSCETESGLCN